MLHLNTIDEKMNRLLEQFSAADYLRNFALAGGTSLALQIGHRQSIDADMFAFTQADMEETALLLQNDYPGITIRRTTKVFIFCHINGIKCDFVNYANVKTIRPTQRIDDIHLYSVEDIAAMKLNAICGRGSKKDFYDIYALLKMFSLRELLNFYDEKYMSDNSWMALKSLQYFEDANNEESPVCIQPFPDWEKLKEAILKDVNDYKLS